MKKIIWKFITIYGQEVIQWLIVIKFSVNCSNTFYLKLLMYFSDINTYFKLLSDIIK